jgi:hypothetical protein
LGISKRTYHRDSFCFPSVLSHPRCYSRTTKD